MICSGPILQLQARNGTVAYDCRLKVPAWTHIADTSSVLEDKPERSARVDRRVPERSRSTPFDFGNGKYKILSLLNGEYLLSACAPATEGVIRSVQMLHAHTTWLQSRARIEIIQGTVFSFGKKVFRVDDENGGPAIPHAFFTSVFAEYDNGRIACWSLIIPNTVRPPALESCLVPTRALEVKVGMHLWAGLEDAQFEASKGKIASRWW